MGTTPAKGGVRLMVKTPPSRPSDVEILRAVKVFHCGGQTPDESLAAKYPVAKILRAMRKLEDRGWLESGVSTRTAWLRRDVIPADVLAEVDA